MEINQILEQITPIFNTVFEKPKLIISIDTTAKDINNWDSLHHVVLIDAIEKEFKVSFDIDDMLLFKSVGDICYGVKKKLS